MKLLKYTIPLLIIFFTYSCSDVTEEIWIEENGTGKSTYSINMYPMMSMINSFTSNLDSDSTQEKSMNIKDNIFKNLEKNVFDTIINFKDLIPDSLKLSSRTEKLEKLENIRLQMNVNKEQKKALISITKPFAKVSDLFEDFSDLSEVNTSKQEGPGADMVNKLLGSAKNINQSISFDKTSFKRSSKIKKEKKEAGFDMSAMLFGAARYITIYHFPYEVKSVNSDNAVIDGKVVTVEKPLSEATEPKEDQNIEIKFKKKKFLGIF